MIGTFRNGGFSVAMSAHAFSAVDSYVYGFSVQETGLPFETEEEAVAMAQVMLAQLPAGEYPYLAELMTKHILVPGYDYGDEFLNGLTLVLDALERARDSE